MAALDNYNLAENSDFRNKVDTLMRKVATQIKGETPTEVTPKGVIDKRGNYADKVFADFTREEEYMCSKTAACLGTLTDQSSDNDIEFTIVSVWDDLSKVNDSDFGDSFLRIRRMAIYDNALKLTIEMLVSAGIESADPAKLDDYKTAVAAEDDFTDIVELQALIDSVNIAP